MRRPSQTARKPKMVDVTEVPLRQGWSVVTNSPESLFTAMAGAIHDTGYHLRRKPPELKRGYTPTAPFISAEITGHKRVLYFRPRSLFLGIALIAAAVLLFIYSIPGSIRIVDGFMMAAGVAFSVVGVLFFDDGYRIYRLSLVGHLRAVSAGSAPQSNSQTISAETYATCVPLLRGIRNKPVDWVKGSREQRILKEDFAELKKRMQSLVSSHTAR